MPDLALPAWSNLKSVLFAVVKFSAALFVIALAINFSIREWVFDHHHAVGTCQFWFGWITYLLKGWASTMTDLFNLLRNVCVVATGRGHAMRDPKHRDGRSAMAHGSASPVIFVE